MTAFRGLFLLLAVFDLALGTALIFFGGKLLGLLGLEAYAEPRFFQICVGLFLYQYVYVQFMAFKDPTRYATCLALTLFVRLTFPAIYIAGVFLWDAPWTPLHTAFVASAAGDLLASGWILLFMRSKGIPLFRGDRGMSGQDSVWLRRILLTLAIAEFLISWNWLLAPGFWLKFFDVSYGVDPFWTRATGVMLLNIAVIQFLGWRDLHRFRTAVITSGIFRALWPVLYWIWTATATDPGQGNFLFKLSIMFFSFFDTAACIVIFWMLKRATRPEPAQPA